jgi:hypothetical protein
MERLLAVLLEGIRYSLHKAGEAHGIKAIRLAYISVAGEAPDSHQTETLGLNLRTI